MNFKSLRADTLKLSIEDFAEQYGISVEKVKEFDETGNPDFNLLMAISSKTGMKLEDIVKYERQTLKALEANNNWKDVEMSRDNFLKFINELLENDDISKDIKEDYLYDLQDMGNGITSKKPRIAIVGRSDTGKSTMINTLLGQEKMPTSWTPTTSIAVYLKHVNDKPSFIKDDEEVWIFTNQKGKDKYWDSSRLYDEEYCNEWKLSSGHVDILRNFGTRQGGGLETEAGSAVVFVDAPILLNCDIVDLPGFGTETKSDDDIVNAAARTDILIYLSQANGFMRIEDITYLKENIRNLPVKEKKGVNDLKPLSNLFVIASQAHTVNHGNEVELSNILKTGYQHLKETLSDGYWKSRTEISGYTYNDEEVLSRFFTYTTDIPCLCEDFMNELKSEIESLPSIINDELKETLKNYLEQSKKPSIKKDIDMYNQLIEQKDKYRKLLQEIDDTAMQRLTDNENEKEKVRSKIKAINWLSKKEFIDFCSTHLNKDGIINRMKQLDIKNKQEDIQRFASKLQDEIRENCSSSLSKKSNELQPIIKGYVDKYDKNIKILGTSEQINVNFNTANTFATGLATLGIIGGLGAYAAGEAIFAFGGVGLIAGIGGDLALAGLALGPIGIAAGLALAGVVGAVKLFSGGWQKKVAEQLSKSFEEKNIAERYIEEIDRYWNNTLDAFEQSSELLEKEWEEYVSSLREEVESGDEDEYKYKINILTYIQKILNQVELD